MCVCSKWKSYLEFPHVSVDFFGILSTELGVVLLTLVNVLNNQLLGESRGDLTHLHLHLLWLWKLILQWKGAVVGEEERGVPANPSLYTDTQYMRT